MANLSQVYFIRDAAPVPVEAPCFKFFTGDDAVFPPAPIPSAFGANNHVLIQYPEDVSSSIYFPGVIDELAFTQLNVNLFWAAGAAGDAVWAVSWERDNAGGPFTLAADSYAPELTVVSTGLLGGEITEANLSFTVAQADNLMQGEPYRLRIRRDGANVQDTMAGPAFLFRVSVQGVP